MHRSSHRKVRRESAALLKLEEFGRISVHDHPSTHPEMQAFKLLVFTASSAS